jgi:hypothetical protein
MHEVDEEDIWNIETFREVKRIVVDARALKNVIMKDANGNIIDAQNLHGKNFLQASNHGRIRELTPIELKSIKSNVVKQVKRREIIKAKKVDLFCDEEERVRAHKAIKFILCIEWSSDGRFLVSLLFLLITVCVMMITLVMPCISLHWI